MVDFGRMHLAIRRLTIALIVFFVSSTAVAAGSLKKNIQLLRSSDDFRVRTQAALALGVSKSERAVAPLCHALGDENRTVRIASATAISRLREGGTECLKRRLKKEKDARVLSALRKAIARLGGAGGAEPTIGPKTRYFVAVEKLSGPSRLDGPVRAAFVKAAKGKSEVAFAPKGQSAAAASKALAKYPRAKGFLLSPKLSRPKYNGGILQVKMSVAILSYPGSALIGSFSKSVGMQVSTQTQESENELVLLATEESMKQFLKLAPSLAR